MHRVPGLAPSRVRQRSAGSLRTGWVPTRSIGTRSWRAGTSAMGSCLRCSTSLVALLAAQAECRKHGPGPPLGWRGCASALWCAATSTRPVLSPNASPRNGPMPEESTTPDSVELTRTFYETMDRDWDFDALAGFFAPDAVWDLSESHLGSYEGVA